MRVVVAGLGVQGNKRKTICGDEFFASVDPANEKADYRNLFQIPLASYDTVLVCTPDEEKYVVIKYCLENGKHVLVEKPFWVDDSTKLSYLEEIARKNGVVCYTAYNHRFEPHFIRMRELLTSRQLGKVYSCRLFYGNGTARLVKQSGWRDKGGGVLVDLAPHLIDTCKFWFGKDLDENWKVVSHNKFENNAPDHAVITLQTNNFRIECEITLLMWRNSFTCDVLAENGTAHIDSLCKWGPSRFIHRVRILPSGKPNEEETVVVQEDPTWALEYAHFRQLIDNKYVTDLSWDKSLLETITRLKESLL